MVDVETMDVDLEAGPSTSSGTLANKTAVSISKKKKNLPW